MIPRTPSNNAKMAAAMKWSVEDASRFVVEIVAMSNNSGYWLHIHQDMPGRVPLKPRYLGDKWVIETGPINFDTQ
jgi:hypothetical protein